jgi:photosystem II stability/assembly factor-like uncharacterized protein
MFGKIAVAMALIIGPTAAVAEWIPVRSSPSYTVNDISDVDGALFLATYGQGVYSSMDSMASWQPMNGGLNILEARLVNQLLSSGPDLFVATEDGIYKSTDDGESWVKKSNGIEIGPGASYLFSKSIFEDNGTLFTGCWSGIYRSSDGGENWEPTNIMGQRISPRLFVNHNGKIFAAREIDRPNGYLSADSGGTWEPLASIPDPTITFLSEPPNLWAGAIGGVWLSTDDGASWSSRNDGLTPDPYNSSIIRVNGRLITSVKFGGSGVFRSANEGINWEDFGDGLPFLSSIEKLIVYGPDIIAATSNGLWQRDTTEVVVGIEASKDILPKSYGLFQNYPNPFNPTTTIQYDLPKATDVTLQIYDVLGSRVETLANGLQEAGHHSITWDGKGESSGIYFYKIQAGNFAQAKMMMLLK